MCLYGFVSSNINLNTEALSYLSDKKLLHSPLLLGMGGKGGVSKSPAKFSKRGCLTGLILKDGTVLRMKNLNMRIH